MTQSYDQTRQRLLDAAMTHVPFDGWSEAAFRAAAKDAGIELSMARAVCPRGAIDLAIASHQAGDSAMEERLTSEPLPERFRDRIAAAVLYRLEAVDDKEVVRRGTTLFALPQHAGDGAKLIWGTADRIWTALGDSSDDINWYTKRMTLSGVYSATVLYWLGDDSPDHQATWAFLDRRIEDVMQIEKFKAQVRDNKFLSAMMTGPNWLISQVKPPMRMPRGDFPGQWSPPQS